jgi:two-component system cell cycle sensor histidine kinase/response regulator CckA
LARMSLAQTDHSNAKPRQTGPAVLIAILSGILALVLAVSAEALWQQLGLGIFGAMVIAVGGYDRLQRLRSDLRKRLLGRFVATIFAKDKAPILLAVLDGRVLYDNAAAGRLEQSKRPTIEQTLARALANPRAVRLRLQDKARQNGWAEETLMTRRRHFNLSARSVGADRILWWIEEVPEGLRESGVPNISVRPEGGILKVNDSARHLIGDDAKTVEDIFQDMPLRTGAIHRLKPELGASDAMVWFSEAEDGGGNIALIPAAAQIAALPESWTVIEELPVPLLKIARSGEILASNRAARTLVQREIRTNARLSDLFEGLGRPIID